jgi:hypothetical protein
VQVVPGCDKAHVTPFVCVSFVTVAVNVCVNPTATVAVAGETLTAITVSVIVADAFFVVSATEVAVNVTVAGVGAVAGAV